MIASVGLLLGDTVGAGPGTGTTGLVVDALIASPTPVGVAEGADENTFPRERSIGLRVGSSDEKGTTAWIGACSLSSVCRRDGVSVGSSGNAKPDIAPVGVLVGDAVGSRAGVAVGFDVSLLPDSSLASGTHIGAGEVVPPMACPVGPLVGVAVA